MTFISPDDQEPPSIEGFTGLWIPRALIEHPGLNTFDMHLAATIVALDGPKGCYATVATLAKKMRCEERTLQRSLARLKKLHLVEEIICDGRQRVLKGYVKLEQEARAREIRELYPRLNRQKTNSKVDRKDTQTTGVTRDTGDKSVTSGVTFLTDGSVVPPYLHKSTVENTTPPYPPDGGGICEVASLSSVGEGGAQEGGGRASLPGPIPPPDVQVAEGVRFKPGELEALLAKCEGAVRAHAISGTGEEVRRECLEQLSAYKGSTGKRYKSDYRAILSWVLPKVVEQRLRLMRLKAYGQSPPWKKTRANPATTPEQRAIYENLF